MSVLIAFTTFQSFESSRETFAITYALRELGDINPGGSSFPSGFTRFTQLGGELYFRASDNPSDLGMQSLHKTDGWSVEKILGGEGLIRDDFFEFNGELYFSANQADGVELFKSNDSR